MSQGFTTPGLLDNSVTDAKLRDSAALSVIGRSANSTGDPADIAGATVGHVLQVSSGPVLAFAAFNTGGPTGDEYNPERIPSSGLDTNASDEFNGSINTSIQTWGNQGTATRTAEMGTCRISTTASATRDRKVLWYTPTSMSVDFVFTTKASAFYNRFQVTGAVFGIIILETGSIATPTLMSQMLFYRTGASTQAHGFYSCTSYTGTDTLIGSESSYAFQTQPTYIQARYVASTKVLSMWASWEGYDWYQVSTNRTLGAHPLNIGIYANQNTVNIAFAPRFYYVRFRTDATGTSDPYPIGG